MTGISYSDNKDFNPPHPAPSPLRGEGIKAGMTRKSPYQ